MHLVYVGKQFDIIQIIRFSLHLLGFGHNLFRILLIIALILKEVLEISMINW